MDKYIVELYWALLECKPNYKIKDLYIDKYSQSLYKLNPTMPWRDGLILINEFLELKQNG